MRKRARIEVKSTAGPDILVVADRVPDFDRASGSLRFYQILQILARKYRVAFLGRVDTGGQNPRRYARALEAVGIEVRPSSEVDVADEVERVGLCVLFELFWTAEQALGRVRLRRPDLPVIVDSVDVHFLRERRATEYAKRRRLARLRAARTRRRELGVYARADLVLAVTEADRAEILRELPTAQVAVVPNIHVVHEAVPGFEARRANSIMFVGGFFHLPNVDGMLHFCRDVLPLVRKKLPDASLTIVGDRPPPEVRALAGEGIVVTGWVPQIEPYLDSHCVGIAPLRYGAGMKGKVGEALAAGLPMVTTSIGAEGMSLEHGRTAMIADSPEAFASAVVQVCTNPDLHRQLSREGLAHVRQRWDTAAVEQSLYAAVDSLRGVRPRRMTSRERLGARASELYVRSGVPGKIARVERVARWYASRLSRIHTTR